MNRQEKRSLFAGLYGNALEWYDFLLYASFAPIFASYFFPVKTTFLSLLTTFAVFAVGFLVRPLGGALFGHYADRVGRRSALIVSVCVMTFSTLGFALLPGYDSLGVLSPVLFVLFRLLQGLAVGGELPGAATFLVEHMASHRRGLAGGLVQSSAILGIFIGTLVAASLGWLFSERYMYAMGWRWAYILGAVLGGVGICLRLYSVETTVFLQEEAHPELPITILIKHYRKPIVSAILLTSMLAIGNYLLIAWVSTFLVKSEGFLLADALLANLLALLLLTLMLPVLGLMSDYLGRKPVLISGLVALIILVFPFFKLITSHNWWYVLWAQLMLALVLSFINATVPTILAEMFPTAIRASGVSLGYNVGQALFGGTLPMVALLLIELTGNKYAPAWYVFLWGLFVLIFIRSIRETYKSSLA